jgi:photosystem I subunit II
MTQAKALPFNGSTPIFGGSTGGLLRAAETEEKYFITWNSKDEQVFEMPTGGAATMVSGPQRTVPCFASPTGIHLQNS